jgi:hypothetical protein
MQSRSKGGPAYRRNGLIRLSAGEIRRLLAALVLHPTTSLDT